MGVEKRKAWYVRLARREDGCGADTYANLEDYYCFVCDYIAVLWTEGVEEAWSQALAGAFRKQYTLEEWSHLVKARQQEIGESAARYALEKSKLLRFCPEPFAERKFVTYLIQGIRHRQFSPGLIQNPPQTIQEFIVRGTGEERRRMWS